VIAECHHRSAATEIPQRRTSKAATRWLRNLQKSLERVRLRASLSEGSFSEKYLRLPIAKPDPETSNGGHLSIECGINRQSKITS
jgi:hypothetical protein